MAKRLDLPACAFFLSVLMHGTLACATMAALAPSGPAQRQFAELGKQHLPVDVDNTWAVALSDVDGDGDADLVLGNAGQNRLYLNSGTGVFTDVTAGRMPIDSNVTVAVATGDMDGDGDPDLIFGNSDGQNRLYLNDGTGGFVDTTPARMPTYGGPTFAVAMGDVDGDGDPDLVFGNGGDQNRLYLNDGTGNFTDATSLRMPTDRNATVAMALGDVDGDGDLDLVFGSYRHWDGSRYVGGENRLYLNNGAGVFSDSTAGRMPVFGDDTLDVALGDVDADGDRDLVFANDAGQNRLYLNDGTGKFTDATSANIPPYSDDTRAVALGDVDGDGDPDLVFGNSDGPNRLYLNRGTGNFPEATASNMPPDSDATLAVTLGDVDGDGQADLVFGNDGGQNRLYLNDRTGAFADATAPKIPPDSENFFAIALDDVDGDGHPDLVLGNGGGQDRLYLNDGTGTFTDATAVRMPPHSDDTLDMALGDVDGDGDTDLVSVGRGKNVLYLNDGRGSFTIATAARMPTGSGGSFAMALGDVDGDGDPDLVVGNFFKQNRLYLNDGTGKFTDATAGRLPVDRNDSLAMALGDVDGDGDPDLVFGIQRQNVLYLNDGTGKFTDATASHMPPNSDLSFAVALGDVDGDGDPDLVFGNEGGQNRLYLNNGTGFFTDATSGRMPPDNDPSFSVALGDVDGDGDPDLVFGNVRGQNRLYLNDGTGIFGDATTARIPPDNDDKTYAVALEDVDGDADADLVFVNSFRPNRLLFNLHRQVHTPFLPILTRTFTMEFHARPGYGTSSHTAFPAVSLALAPTPLSLPPLGSLYLDPNGIINLLSVAIPASTGRGRLDVTVPADTSLIGQTVYVQALIVNDAQPVDSHLTGYTADLIIK